MTLPTLRRMMRMCRLERYPNADSPLHGGRTWALYYKTPTQFDPGFICLIWEDEIDMDNSKYERAERKGVITNAG